MSKVKSQNLSYGVLTHSLCWQLLFIIGSECNEPSFLRKLRSKHGGADSVRHERPVARPRKQATGGEDDDQPTYVVEGSQDTLSKQEYEALIRKEQGEGESQGKSEGRQQTLFEASASKEEAESEGNITLENCLDLNKENIATIGGNHKKRNVTAIGADDKEDNEESGKKRPIKAKRGKKVKLSFDEE